jgi:predicted DNA-binding protein (MmcQ/YjbR family)
MSVNFLYNFFRAFLFLEITEQDIFNNNLLIFMCIARYSIQILIKLKNSPQIFEEYSNINFQENSSSGR